MRAAALGLLLLLVAPAARAQTWVRVRAECRIELRTERRPGEVRIVGTLRDDLGAPLADRDVTLTVSTADPSDTPLRLHPRTDAEGRFSAPLGLDTGAYTVRAGFDGDLDHEKNEVEVELDLARADVSLRVNVPSSGRLRLDRPTHAVRVDASSEEGGGGLSVELTDELGRVLGQGETDASGRLDLVLASSQLEPPAAGRLIARSAGDARRAQAQTEVPIVRVGPTAISLTSAAPSARAGDPVVVTGELHDHHGLGVARAAVGIYLGRDARTPLATVLTSGRDGAFEAHLTMPADVDALDVVARFESDAPWRASSESPHVVVRRTAPAGTPWPWLALMSGVTALAVALLARRARGPGVRDAERAPVLRPPGIQLAERRGIRPERLDVAGVVLDARDEGPVVGARITLSRDGHAPHTIDVDAEGRFALAQLAAGAWALTVDAAGYAPMEATLTLPHRGEWSSLRVRLASLRGRALDAVLAVAGEILPPRAAVTATPRELALRLHGRSRAAAPAAELARTAERAAFAEAPPTDAILVETEAARDATLGALRDERARDAGERPSPPSRGRAIDR